MPEQMEQASSVPATTSHMMKVTKRGRPFLKDTLDLFATLIVSLNLSTNKQFFKSFPNSFTTDQAAANLAALKFSQSNRGPDPRDPSRIVTTTTTTTFSMTRDMAKAMCQHFMDARLIENAADRSSNLFKDRGVYVLTPKGLHVLERFISKNGISAEPLSRVFASQPICLKLLHLERRSSDDEIIISQSVVTALFRRFAGRSPNYVPESHGPMDPATEYNERSKGIPLMDVVDRQSAGLMGRGTGATIKNCFQAVTALEWLSDFTSIVGRDESAEMAAHFVRFGLIELVSDKRKGNDSAIIFTVRGSGISGNGGRDSLGEFRCTSKAIYRITEEGKRVARWETGAKERPSLEKAESTPNAKPSSHATTNGSHSAPDSKIQRRVSASEKLRDTYEKEQRRGQAQKESNMDRLRFIIDEPALRSLFRKFLSENYCEENLSFWFEVEDFKRKFGVTSTAVAAMPQYGAPRGKSTPGQQAMEKHHESLIQMAFEIYNKYLAPASERELNIDHGLRNELVSYLSQQMTDVTGKAFQGRVDPEQAHQLNATQLQTMIHLYDRIQNHVFRLMATDSIPKFLESSQFMALRSWQEDYENQDEENPNGHPVLPPGLGGDLDEEEGRVYDTVSQQANEQVLRQQRLEKQLSATHL